MSSSGLSDPPEYESPSEAQHRPSSNNSLHDGAPTHEQHSEHSNAGEKSIPTEKPVDTTKPSMTGKPAPAEKPATTRTRMARPPDGGWGWFVVASSLLIHVVMDGITYSFGIIFSELTEYFQSDKGDAAWILSILVGITLLSGPLACALVNKYSCRTVTILGSIIAAIGFLLSPSAGELWILYITIGVVGGIGMGFVYLPAIVIVGYYFEKYRAVATGLAVCGSGIGTFMFAPVGKILVDEYGWRGCCIITGGFMLQCCIFGAIFRPLPLEPDEEEEQAPLDKSGEKLGLPDSKLPSKDSQSCPATHRPKAVEPAKAQVKSSHNLSPDGGENSRHHRVLHRKDIFYSASLYNIPLYASNRQVYTTANVNDDHHKDQDSSTKKSAGRSCLPHEFREAFTEMIDLSLLQDRLFVMFLVSNFFTNLGFNAPFLFINDRALEAGVSKTDAAFLISVIGIANMAGRIFFGVVADIPVIKPYRLYIYNTGLVIAGVATSLSVFGDTYILMALYSATFGLFIGGYVSLTSVILVDLLGLDKLTSSFGMTLLVQGVAVVVGPPICGVLRDETGDYFWSFVVTGIFIAASGCLLFTLPLLARQKEDPNEAEAVAMGRRLGLSTQSIHLHHSHAKGVENGDAKKLSPGYSVDTDCKGVSKAKGPSESSLAPVEVPNEADKLMGSSD